eukprot:4147635-Pleurochrysis_carterae.AAC.7
MAGCTDFCVDIPRIRYTTPLHPTPNLHKSTDGTQSNSEPGMRPGALRRTSPPSMRPPTFEAPTDF